MFNTQLKKQLAEQTAELNELRQLVDGLQREMLTLSLDPQMRIDGCNEGFAKALGYSVGQLVGRPMAEIVPAYVSKLPCYHNLMAAIGSASSITDDYRFLRADGVLVWIRAHWQPVIDASGTLAHVRCFANNITSNVERAAESTSFIDALLRSTAVIEFDLKGTVLSANDQFLRAMGYSLSQVKGQHHRLFCTSEETSSPKYAEFWATLNRGEFVSGRFKRIDSHGHTVWLEATYNPVYDPEGNSARW